MINPTGTLARIGFMQGRLVAPIDGRIQAFPTLSWREEFPIAESLGFTKMEWTLDADGLYDNPLMTSRGRREIAKLSRLHGVAVESVTGDCFMQRPFWKTPFRQERESATMLTAVAEACADLGIRTIVLPAVDDASVSDLEEEMALLSGLVDSCNRLDATGVRIAIESDFGPSNLARLVDQLPPETIGVNYDIGNSAANDHDPTEEFALYGPRIINVHVKDRPVGGPTVPLGEGDAQIGTVLGLLDQVGYSGNLILQAARAPDGDHSGMLEAYRAYVKKETFQHGT